MIYLDIGHNWLKEYSEKIAQCVIFIGAYKVKIHKCGVIAYTIKMGKICIYIISKCANCKDNHQATALKCLTKQKTQVVA